MRQKNSIGSSLLASASNAMGVVGEALGFDGSERCGDSLSSLTKLKSLMEELQKNTALTLREKKDDFLKQAPRYIANLTTKHLVELFDLYRVDIQRGNKQYCFIYAEDTSKAVGWIKHTIFKSKDPTGNTKTHKLFLELLKKRALANIDRHNTDRLRTVEQNTQELSNLRLLMETTRGRVPNLLSAVGLGCEGEYKEWRRS